MTTESVTTPSLSPVPFHGQTLFVTEVNGQPYTPLRPIVEGMGMAWQAQHAKVKSKSERWGVMMIVTPSQGGEQTTLCLPLRKLPGWLMTINPSKVAPSLRGNVVLYQTECDDALWDFWTKGQATNKRMVEAGEAEAAAGPSQIDPCTETLLTPISRQVLSEDVRHGVALIAAKTGNEGSSYLERKKFYQLAACKAGARNSTRMVNHEVAKVLPVIRQQLEIALGEKIDWRPISQDGRYIIEKIEARPTSDGTARTIPAPARLEPASKNASDRIEEIVESLTRACQGNDKFIYDVEHDVEKIIKDELAKIDFMSIPSMERHETMEMVRELARSFREQTHQIIVAHNAVRPILRAMARIAKMTESRMAGQYGSPAALPSGRGRPSRKALGR